MIPVGHRISPDAARSLHTVRVHDSSVYGNLSRVSWKLSRTVLRGGTRRKVGPLLDSKRQGGAKQPYCFKVSEGQLFAFAGLWEGWKERERYLDQNVHTPSSWITERSRLRVGTHVGSTRERVGWETMTCRALEEAGR